MPALVRLSSIATVAAATVALAAGAAVAAVGGTDVASFQHPNGAAVDWSTVRSSGQSFVFVKATEGSTYTNPYFTMDWAGSQAAGLLHGAYHFARPSVGSAVTQAEHFVSVIGATPQPGELPPALDLEVTGGLTPAQLVTWTRRFLTTVQSLTGRTPVLYTYPSFWQTAMADSSAFTGYPLWVASYGAAPASIVWRTWTFWQTSATGRVPGLSGQVDMDRFNGTPSELTAMANLTPGSPVAQPQLVTPRIVPRVTARLSTRWTGPWRTVHLTGSVTPPLAGQLVFRQRMVGDRWRWYGHAAVSRSGTYRFDIHPVVRHTYVYRIYVTAAPGRTAAASPTVRLTVG